MPNSSGSYESRVFPNRGRVMVKFRSPRLTDEEQEEFDRQVGSYHREIYQTQGFKVGVYPKIYHNRCLGGIVMHYNPPDLDLSEDELQILVDLSKQAIDEYNTTNSVHYRFRRVLMAARLCVGGAIYFITFKASPRRSEDRRSEIFQAKVYKPLPCDREEPEVKMVRIKPATPPPSPGHDHHVSGVASSQTFN